MIVIPPPLEPDIILPTVSSPPSPGWLPQLTSNCAVCGDRVANLSLGSPACLGCFHFFRRSVSRKSTYKCSQENNCLVSYEYRVSCRFCRLKRCFEVGMKSSAVRRREPSVPFSPTTSLPSKRSSEEPQLITSLVKLQSRQLQNHKQHSVKTLRRASAADVNLMFKWSFNDSIEWASRFEPFKNLSSESQKCVTSEFGIAFFLIDQGIKTVSENVKDDYWLLQNGTFLDSDSHENSKLSRDQLEFLKTLETSVKHPFQLLKIDEFETAALKTLLLLAPSFSKPNIFYCNEDRVMALRSKCLQELMEHSARKHPEQRAERFGDIILLLGEIRNSVKAVYNHTKVCELFDRNGFETFVRRYMLS